MIIKNVNVGDKFATENKLIKELGLVPAKDNSKKAQLKEIKRYLNYKKTHKFSRGKETNEIIITQIYDSPLNKIDKRTEKSSAYIDCLIISFKYIVGRYTTPMLMEKIGLINDKDDMNTFSELDSAVKTYKNELKSEFKRKAISTFKRMQKNNNKFSFELSYFLQEFENQDFYKWHKATSEETEIINQIILKNKHLIEEKYQKDFKRLKYNNAIYQEYFDNINSDIQNEMDYIGCVQAFDINNNSSFDYENDIEALLDSYENIDADDIKYIFSQRMNHIINTYKYDINKYHRIDCNNKENFGQITDIYNKENYIYPLKTDSVFKFHKEIFDIDYYVE